MIEIGVGTLVRVKLPMGSIAEVGDQGVCYEAYILGGRPGWSIIFERGHYDGFSPAEAEAFLEVAGVSGPLSSYVFTNALQLQADFRRGIFGPAFETDEATQ